ncbi:MAG: ATP-binding protein [Bryobacteraceae bacterium]|jgi:light-regulated signal transduction histidine kinase (bacteriophytochrome)
MAIHLKLPDLSKEQVATLLKLSFSGLSFAMHDLSKSAAIASYSVDALLLNVAASPAKEPHGDQTADLRIALRADLDRAVRALHSFSKTLALVEAYRPLDTDEPFLTCPDDLLNVVRARYPQATVLAAEHSPRSLAIVYPANTLTGIIAELVSNAVHAAGNDPTVSINWSVTNLLFMCDVHDNGPGFAGVTTKRFLPLDAIPQLHDNMKHSGLSLINRIVRDSKGLFLLSRSETLGGAMVHIELPVIASYTSPEGANQ